MTTEPLTPEEEAHARDVDDHFFSHKHDWTDAFDDETGWHCTICGLTLYPSDKPDPEDLVAAPTTDGTPTP